MEKCPRYTGKWKEKDAEYLSAISNNLWGVQSWVREDSFTYSKHLHTICSYVNKYVTSIKK